MPAAQDDKAGGSGVPWVDALPARWADRLVGLALLLPSGAILAIAAALHPDASGLGTHRQLGLSPCTFLSLTGYPCPMCGMTTTFSLYAHLHPLRALANQPFGLVLFSATVAAAVVGALDLVAPRGRWRAVLRWVTRHETLVASILLVGMILGWIYKIALVRGFFVAGP